MIVISRKEGHEKATCHQTNSSPLSGTCPFFRFLYTTSADVDADVQIPDLLPNFINIFYCIFKKTQVLKENNGQKWVIIEENTV